MKKASAVQNMKQTAQNKKESLQKEQEMNLKNLSDIKKKLTEMTKEQKKFLNLASGNKMTMPLILGIVIGLLVGLFIGSNSLMLYVTNKDWVVPKEMRVKNKNGYFIVNKKDIWSLNKSKVNQQSKIIKLKDL